MLELNMDKRTSGAQAADALRAEILSGRIAHGTEISQEEIAQSLGLSRMPVREALATLEGEGLIERLDNRHTRVIGMTDGARASRMTLLCDMTALAVAALDDADREELRAWWQAATDTPRAHVAFHARLYAACSERFTRQLYGRVFAGFLEYVIMHGDGALGKAEIEAALTNASPRPALARYYARINTLFSEE